MSECFVNPAPIGVNPPFNSDRRPIYRGYVGDDIVLSTKVMLDSSTAATPDNSILYFELQDQRFETDVVWSAQWRTGIEPVSQGIIEIKIPQAVSDTLRRGSYLFSLRVQNIHSNRTRTVMTGSLLMEYAATSPHHDIPYNS